MKLSTDTLLHIIIALLLPPVAVFLKRGFGAPLLINVVLTICLWLPGAIHAVLVVLGKLK